MNLIKILLFVLVLLCGCTTPSRTWEVKMFQPTGELHATYAVTFPNNHRPRVYSQWNGMQTVGNIRAPVGWLLMVGHEVK